VQNYQGLTSRKVPGNVNFAVPLKVW